MVRVSCLDLPPLPVHHTYIHTVIHMQSRDSLSQTPPTALIPVLIVTHCNDPWQITANDLLSVDRSEYSNVTSLTYAS